MKIQAVKGTRDFYPDDMRMRNWITDAWRRVSLRNGFEEYDAPIFEYLDLFTIKSGQEIAEQLFRFTDRGGRNLAIRPEITPSLARMVNARINALPRPIKWFSIPRLCRAENPQKGRLREFFQWNIDVIGEDSETADAECVFVAVDALRELGLSENDAALRYSSRQLLTEVLRASGLGEQDLPPVMALLDKKSKLPPEAFGEMLVKAVPGAASREAIQKFLDLKEIPSAPAGEVASSAGLPTTTGIVQAIEKVQRFQQAVRDFGIESWCRFDPSVVRGLAYYTGVVYEVFDAGESLRAVAGGGRYDNLLEVLGGPKVGATGFGMGDVVLGILLQEKGILPALKGSLEFFVIEEEPLRPGALLATVGALRRMGLTVDFSYKGQALGKQLKEANRRGARKALILRGEQAVVKDLTSGEQREMPLADLLKELTRQTSS